MNKSNIKLTIAYEGTRYCGWQDNGDGPSIEGQLRAVLEQILQHEVVLQASSRTDAGVHALGQVVNFLTDRTPEGLQVSLNQLLPTDIRVLSLEKADEAFHPTLNAKGKIYCYRFCNSEVQMPNQRFYSWHVREVLDLKKMQKAADQLVGTHDFSAFCNQRKDLNYATKVRTLSRVEVSPQAIEMEGDAFLYRMARNIAGTLIDIGRGEELDIKAILDGQDRTKAGVTAPAHGLTLTKILYTMDAHAKK